MRIKTIGLLVSLLLMAPATASLASANDRPFKLGLQEMWVDQTASPANPREIPFADVAVLKLEGRSVRLRFALGTGPAPSVAPAPVPLGRALVTVHLRLAVTLIP